MKVFSEHWQRDVLVLMASRGVRALAFSYLSIVFAIYSAQLRHSGIDFLHRLRYRRWSYHAFTAGADRRKSDDLRLSHALVLVERADFLGDLLQLINDFSFYFLFWDVKPPEEQTAKPHPVTALT